MKTFLKIAGIFTVFGVIGIGVYAGKVYHDIKNISYELVKYQFKGIKEGKAFIDFILRIKNISIVRIKIVGYEFDIFINDIRVGAIKGTKEQVIKPEQYSLLSIPLGINLAETFGLVRSADILSSLATNPKAIVISLKGMFAAEVFKLKVKNIPIDYSISLQEIISIMNEPTPTT